MTTRCARCKRKVKKPMLVAGMALGPTCARAVVGFFRAPPADRAATEPDPRQVDLFSSEDRDAPAAQA